MIFSKPESALGYTEARNRSGKINIFILRELCALAVPIF